jgi:DNA modification methylase
MEDKNVRLMQGDCLQRMAEIEDGSVSLIASDLPYQVTACRWDTLIPFEPLWAYYRRILKPRGAVVLTASQPFTSMLVMSNPKWFKYCWVWDKKKPAGFQIAKYRPMMVHEDIVVFSGGSPIYNPIKTPRPTKKRRGPIKFSESAPLKYSDDQHREYVDWHPKSILEVSNADQTDRVHPTQKPVSLMEYLIRTYSNEGDLVHDSTMGSGTCGVACVNTGRRFVGIEKDPKYFAIAERRIAEAQQATPLFRTQEVPS